MNTAEMWLKAQNDGLTYYCPEHGLLYSKNTGLIDNDEFNDSVYMGDFCSVTLNELMNYRWTVAVGFMTVEEAEKKFGIKIIRN